MLVSINFFCLKATKVKVCINESTLVVIDFPGVRFSRSPQVNDKVGSCVRAVSVYTEGVMHAEALVECRVARV